MCRDSCGGEKKNAGDRDHKGAICQLHQTNCGFPPPPLRPLTAFLVFSASMDLRGISWAPVSLCVGKRDPTKFDFRFPNGSRRALRVGMGSCMDCWTGNWLCYLFSEYVCVQRASTPTWIGQIIMADQKLLPGSHNRLMVCMGLATGSRFKLNILSS